MIISLSALNTLKSYSHFSITRKQKSPRPDETKSTTENPEPEKKLEITPEVCQAVLKPLIQFTNKKDEIEIPMSEESKEIQDRDLFTRSSKIF